MKKIILITMLTLGMLGVQNSFGSTQLELDRLYVGTSKNYNLDCTFKVSKCTEYCSSDDEYDLYLYFDVSNNSNGKKIPRKLRKASASTTVKGSTLNKKQLDDIFYSDYNDLIVLNRSSNKADWEDVEVFTEDAIRKTTVDIQPTHNEARIKETNATDKTILTFYDGEFMSAQKKHYRVNFWGNLKKVFDDTCEIISAQLN